MFVVRWDQSRKTLQVQVTEALYAAMRSDPDHQLLRWLRQQAAEHGAERLTIAQAATATVTGQSS